MGLTFTAAQRGISSVECEAEPAVVGKNMLIRKLHPVW